MSSLSSLLVGTESVAPLHSTLIPEALEKAAKSGSLLSIARRDSDESEFSLRELLDRATRMAKHLISLGVKAGDRVLVMLPTSDSWLVSFYGILLAGAVAVPVGPTMAFAGLDRYNDTIMAVFRAADARVLIGNSTVEQHLSALSRSDWLFTHFVRADGDIPATDHPVLFPTRDQQDAAVIQFTSGTTGLPKGVVLSHEALLRNAWMIGQRVRMSNRDVGVSWLPLFHDMGLIGALLTSLYFQYPLLMMPVESFLLQPRRWLQWISKKRATLSVAPNFAYQLLAEKCPEKYLAELDLGSWRLAFSGAEAVRPSTVRSFINRFRACGFQEQAFQPVYGMAENSLAATFPEENTSWFALAREGREITSVGTPLAGVTIAVRGGNEIVPQGKEGAIWLKSPSLMTGYFRNEQATRETIQDGWLHTGDMGFVQDGQLFVTGRSKEIIIKRGHNYAPHDFESIAVSVGKERLFNAAAFGTNHEQDGTERIVMLLEGNAMPHDELEKLKKDISQAIVSEMGVNVDLLRLVPVRTIERTTSGKIKRSRLHERFMQGEFASDFMQGTL